MVIVFVGAGAGGRIAMGRALASELGWPFLDAEAVHAATHPGGPPSGVAPRAGVDRTSRTAALHAIIARVIGRREHLVVACAPLAPGERESLKGDLRTVRFVDLGGVLPAGRLPDELPEVVTVDAATPQAEVLGIIRREFGT
jgi:gluconate kinase